MVLGYHVILSAYGFWLPNDPRGSWSDFVRSWELFRFGRATKVDTRQSVAQLAHNHAARLSAKRALRYPPVRFTGLQAREIGQAFGEFAARSKVTIFACSILPEHVHLVIARHDYPVEQIANLLKGAATRHLVAGNLHPLAAFALPPNRIPAMWSRGLWKVFLNREHGVHRAIRYVERNPAREGKLPQKWSFVTALRS
ncbi:MAG TPA: transposase [Phycisphaerae bacterium]|nr:transposase [Phycisphaerae bacterium]